MPCGENKKFLNISPSLSPPSLLHTNIISANEVFVYSKENILKLQYNHILNSKTYLETMEEDNTWRSPSFRQSVVNKM